MSVLPDASILSVVLHLAIVVGVSVRVIMLRPEPGVALAWLFLVALLPLGGLLLYLAFGERRVGLRRAERMATLRTDFDEMGREFLDEGMTGVDWSRHPVASQGLGRLGTATTGVPTLTGCELELYSDPHAILLGIAADIDAAQSSVHLEFYIWNAGGDADEVLEALIRAAGRGVRCRVLVDHLGARPWLRGKQPKRLRAAGVEVRGALPVGLIQGFFSRNDLRLHRKIVAIDGRLAWTGSMNLVDPRFFKQDAGVGRWVDAMARVQGYAVLPLGATLMADWKLEGGEPSRELLRSADLHEAQPRGHADVQVVPSGPAETSDAILQMILGLVYAARSELILTTPYFVPDQSMKRALRAAASRGVAVDLIVPARNDSFLVRHASQSYYEELMDAGVRIHAFHEGLLHTKSITADGELSMFGTVNLDMRSLWLNHEVSLFVYDADFTRRLCDLQRSYLKGAERIDPAAWRARPASTRFLENTVRLVSPLL